MTAAAKNNEIRASFKDVSVGTRFFYAYGHDLHVKVSDTEAARFTNRKTVYSFPVQPDTSCKLYSDDHPYSAPVDVSELRIDALATVQKGTLLGYVEVEEGVVQRQSYEVAAWFRDHAIVPGTYPVYANGLGQYGVPMYTVELPTIIKDACLASLFGGVGYGKDVAGQREIGTKCSLVLGNGGYDYVENSPPFHGNKGFKFISASLVEMH